MSKAEKTHITKTTVNRALRAARDGRDFEIRDDRVARLSIRVRGRKATWTLRLRIGDVQTTRTIASLNQIGDPDQVRALAIRGKEMGAKGEDPAPLFEAARLEGSGELNAAEAEAKKRSGRGWTWEQLRDAYLEDIRKRRSPDTYRSYKSALNLPDFRPLHGKLISLIEPDEIREVRDSITARGKERQTRSSMQQLKQCLDWALEQRGSGLKSNPARDVKLTPPGRTPTKEDALREIENGDGGIRFLSEEELGTILWELDTLPRREFALALTLQLFTAQRRSTIASALKKAFIEDGRWGLVWVIHPGLIKAKRPHALPLPDMAARTVRSAMELSRRDSPWLFPQTRLRFAADDGSGHVSTRTLNAQLESLQAPGRRLHTEHPFSTHVFRSTFSTYMSRRKFPKETRALILHHSEGRAETVEDLHYNADPMMADKAEILKAWEKLILELTEQYAPN
jgi:integrase